MSSYAPIRERLRAIRNHFGLNQSEMTRRFRLGTGGWQRLENEGRLPKDQALAGLAEAGIDLNWLSTGVGGMLRDVAEVPVSQEIDGKLMGLALEGLKQLYSDENARLDDRSAGELATRVYAETLEKCEGSDDPDDRRAALQLVLSKLRRDLRSTDTATQSKRQA